MKPTVSILVPVYNVSSHIEKCAHSLFNQTFANIEYVFVNDASPDDSMEKLNQIILQYPQRKDFIKIINHPVNKGIATTRNTAIDNSTGKYIAVVEGDDYIEPEMIEKLYKKAEKEKADIVVSDIIMQYKNKSEIILDCVYESKEENIESMINNEKSHSYLWNKLIRRELYERQDCRVPDGLNYLEDRHVMTRLYFYAKKIVKVNKPYYNFAEYNKTAVSKNKNRMHFQNVLQFWILLDAFLIENNLHDKYEDIITLSKLSDKTRLMFETKSMRIRKEFANMFLFEENKHFHQLKLGEKLMLLFIRYRLFFLTHFLRRYLILKTKIKSCC